MTATLKTRFRNAVTAASVAVVTVLSGANSHAAVYSASWDPKFGTPFADTTGPFSGQVLGWSGSVEIYVPNACLVGTYQAVQGAGCNANSDPLQRQHVIGASVSLYDWNLNPGDTGYLKDTLLFSPNGLYPFALNSVDISGGNVVGIATSFSQPFEPNNPGNFAGINDYGFSLGFSLEQGPSLLALTGSQMARLDAGEFVYDLLAGSEVAQSWWAKNIFEPYFFKPAIQRATAAGNASDPLSEANLTLFRASFSEVSEPGTLALALAAFGGLLAARRRKEKVTSLGRVPAGLT